MRTSWGYALPLSLLLTVGCAGATTATPGGTPARAGSTARPALQPDAVDGPPRALAGCPVLGGGDLTAATGLIWRAGGASLQRNGCHASLATVPADGTLQVSFSSSRNAARDAQDRLRDLAPVRALPTTVSLPDLGLGVVSGGVALVQDSTTFWLYLATTTGTVSLACELPPGAAGTPHGRKALATTARGLLAWAMAHEPAQL